MYGFSYVKELKLCNQFAWMLDVILCSNGEKVEAKLFKSYDI